MRDVGSTDLGSFDPRTKEMIINSLAIFEKNKEITLAELIRVAKENGLLDGLYYIVLMDLSKSTIVSHELGDDIQAKWIAGFEQLTKDALNFSPTNVSVFVKTVGDSVLYIFTNFDDIIKWRNRVNELCSNYNKQCIAEKRSDLLQYHTKTIVNVGQVYFDENKDPHSFATNIVFKIEKRFQKGEFGITEIVRRAILPMVNSGKVKTEKNGEYLLDGTKYATELWKIEVQP